MICGLQLGRGTPHAMNRHRKRGGREEMDRDPVPLLHKGQVDPARMLDAMDIGKTKLLVHGGGDGAPYAGCGKGGALPLVSHGYAGGPPRGVHRRWPHPQRGLHARQRGNRQPSTARSDGRCGHTRQRPGPVQIN
ncbi:unnamed protein product [Urochloa humidicola]